MQRSISPVGSLKGHAAVSRFGAGMLGRKDLVGSAGVLSLTPFTCGLLLGRLQFKGIALAGCFTARLEKETALCGESKHGNRQKGSDDLADPRPTAPNDDEWRALYNAASGFFALKPWQWLDDDHLFGVYDEEGDTVGYACILGALGEVLGLGVYPGPRGYSGLRALMESGTDGASMDDAVAHQYALMASFDDRRDLSAADLQVIRRLGMTYRGRQSWPSFRFYEPGYWPSPLSSAQARFLTRALHEAAIVAQQYRNTADALTQRPGQILVRRPNRSRSEWVSSWEPAPALQYPTESTATMDVGFIKLGRTLPFFDAVWEIDFFYLPITIGDPQDRPKMPRACLVVDHETGLILNVELEEDHFIERVWHALIQTMRKAGGKPRAFWVRQTAVALPLVQFAESLGIELLEMRALPQITEARRGLLASLRER